MPRFPITAALTAAVIGLAAPAATQAGYYGPCYRLTSTVACAPACVPGPVYGPTVRAAPTFLTMQPAPVVYSGASYAFSGPSFTAGSAYAPNYVAPYFNQQRYPSAGPYYYTQGGSLSPGYYSYYYTPGYFRY
jgi:hypothetical protein